MKFSANLGFLWTERPLPDAIRAAKAAGFDAVEMHWPYDTPAETVRAVLAETGLPLLGINTRKGDVAAGENGLCALPGREGDARAAIDEAMDYAAAAGAAAVHVMAGFATGAAAEDVFCANLRHASAAAGRRGLTVLIEPLNRYDAPGYFLRTTEQAVGILDRVGAGNVKLMFDCYHVQLTEGDLTHRIERLLPRIGHVQFASVPARGEPSRGEVAYGHVFETLAALGWDMPLGAEYKPGGPTEATLDWLPRAQRRQPLS